MFSCLVAIVLLVLSIVLFVRVAANVLKRGSSSAVNRGHVIVLSADKLEKL